MAVDIFIVVVWAVLFYVLWCAGVWLAEKHDKNNLPPPDRSVKRNIQITDEMERMKAKRRKEA